MPTSAHETRQYCAEQVRGVDRKRRTISIVASDFSRDSYGTRIDQSGWDLSQFLKNPVILGCHNDRQFALARAIPETVKVEGQQTSMDIQFPDEGKHPEADIAFNLYADGFMRGVSVGFVPLEWEDVDEPNEDGTVARVRIYRKARLLEVSLVSIPSNDNALAQRAAKLNREDLVAPVREQTEQLERILREKPVSTSAVTTLRIKDVAVKVGVQEGDLPAFEKEFTKVAHYFENKQPANRAATKVLAKFFKARGIEVPAEEAEAWERMGELLDEKPKEEVKAEEKPDEEPAKPADEPKAEEAPATVSVEATVEAVPESKPDEKLAEEPAAQETPEESPTPPTPEPAVEALQPARKASVQIPLSSVLSLRRKAKEVADEALVKASREGVPASDWAKLAEAAVRQYLATISHS